ncbi:MAG TPA: ArsR family transcriptional regulator [Longimicrobiaceae bacterium]|nr:ArsR family transcriptional regulator [Longimicrobiaceae bacterium]
MRGTTRAKTRGRILALICGGDRTAGELAEAIGISASAVRVHLAGLAAEGLVGHDRVIRGVGKPAHRYRLTAAGEGLLSRAYLPLVDSLLDVLASRMKEEEVEELLRAVGRHLAERRPRASGDGSARVRAAAELIEALGGLVEIEPSPAGATLQGRCCPLGAISPEHPQVCRALEETLAVYTGLPVRERCDRTGRPSCRFDVALPAVPA